MFCISIVQYASQKNPADQKQIHIVSCQDFPRTQSLNTPPLVVKSSMCWGWTPLMLAKHGKTRINHPFGNGLYNQLWWFGGWFVMVVLPRLFPYVFSTNRPKCTIYLVSWVCLKIGHPATPKVQWIFIRVWTRPHHILPSVACPALSPRRAGFIALVENTMVSHPLFDFPLYIYHIYKNIYIYIYTHTHTYSACICLSVISVYQYIYIYVHISLDLLMPSVGSQSQAGEGTFGANAGLPDVAVGLLKPISDKYVPDTISHADLWTLAANVAIKVGFGWEGWMGGLGKGWWFLLAFLVGIWEERMRRSFLRSKVFRRRFGGQTSSAGKKSKLWSKTNRWALNVWRTFRNKIGHRILANPTNVHFPQAAFRIPSMFDRIKHWFNVRWSSLWKLQRVRGPFSCLGWSTSEILFDSKKRSKSHVWVFNIHQHPRNLSIHYVEKTTHRESPRQSHVVVLYTNFSTLMIVSILFLYLNEKLFPKAILKPIRYQQLLAPILLGKANYVQLIPILVVNYHFLGLSLGFSPIWWMNYHILIIWLV